MNAVLVVKDLNIRGDLVNGPPQVVMSPCLPWISGTSAAGRASFRDVSKVAARQVRSRHRIMVIWLRGDLPRRRQPGRCSGRLFEAQLAGGARRRDQPNVTPPMAAGMGPA
jgi:hypothetical protein